MKTVVLPFPDSKLQPNARIHFQALAKLRKKARQDGFHAARAEELKAADCVNGLKITFVQNDKRRRDLDNLLAGMKGYLDGVAQAAGVDDSVFRPLTLDRAIGAQKCVIVEFFGVGNE